MSHRFCKTTQGRQKKKKKIESKKEEGKKKGCGQTGEGGFI